MLKEKLKDYHIILASGSPRRQQFFKELGLDFEIRLKAVEEIYPKELIGSEISDYLSELKAKAFSGTLKSNEILITSDTVVWHNNQSLAKAADKIEASEMLRTLSNEWHQVITSVTFMTNSSVQTVHDCTEVKFGHLSEKEIEYYVSQCKPYDKAGAYGIQEWIGLVAIEAIKGSYTNVVGLPTHLVYKTLINMAS